MILGEKDMSIDLDVQIACLNRELAVRRLVYPKWIETGRMTRKKANVEIEAMQAAINSLMVLRAQGPMKP
jgi:hypothetical protein